MGLSLSRAKCVYGIKGVLVNSTNNLFQGFVLTSGEIVKYDTVLPGAVHHTHKIMVPDNEYIVSITLVAPILNQVYGTLSFTDSSGTNYSCACQVRNYTNQDHYQVSFSVSNPTSEILTSIGIGYDYHGNTILKNMSSGIKPQLRTLILDNAGCIGWIEHPVDGFVGLISDGGQWCLFADYENSNTTNLVAKYFRKAFLLTNFCLNRQIDHSTVLFNAMDESRNLISYSSFQQNILGVNNSFNYFSPVDQPQVIKSISYLTVPNDHNQDRMDFLVCSATSDEYKTPELESYGEVAEEQSNFLRPLGRMIAFFVAVILIALAFYIIYKQFVIVEKVGKPIQTTKLEDETV